VSFEPGVIIFYLTLGLLKYSTRYDCRIYAYNWNRKYWFTL